MYMGPIEFERAEHTVSASDWNGVGAISQVPSRLSLPTYFETGGELSMAWAGADTAGNRSALHEKS